MGSKVSFTFEKTIDNITLKVIDREENDHQNDIESDHFISLRSLLKPNISISFSNHKMNSKNNKLKKYFRMAADDLRAWTNKQNLTRKDLF